MRSRYEIVGIRVGTRKPTTCTEVVENVPVSYLLKGPRRDKREVATVIDGYFRA